MVIHGAFFALLEVYKKCRESAVTAANWVEDREMKMKRNCCNLAQMLRMLSTECVMAVYSSNLTIVCWGGEMNPIQNKGIQIKDSF